VDEVDVETVEVVLEVGAVWDNPAKRRVTSVVEKNILRNSQALIMKVVFLADGFLF
jgi:hypothetical protein